MDIIGTDGTGRRTVFRNAFYDTDYPRDFEPVWVNGTHTFILKGGSGANVVRVDAKTGHTRVLERFHVPLAVSPSGRVLDDFPLPFWAGVAGFTDR